MRIGAAAFVLVTLLSTARVAAARENVAATRAQARRALQRGDLARACPSFERVRTAAPSALSAFESADCEERAGRLELSLERYREAFAAASGRDEALARRAQGRITMLDAWLTARRSPPPEAAPAPPAETVTVRDPAPMPAPSPAPLVVTAPTRAAPAPAPASGGTTRATGFVAIATGAAALAVGGTTAFLALRRAESVRSECDDTLRCSEAGLVAAREGGGLATTATATLIGGAALVAIGVTLLVLSPRTSPTNVAVVAGPARGAVTVSW